MSKGVRMAGSVVLLGLLAWRLDWGQLFLAFSHLDVRWWAGAVGVFTLAQLVSTVRWQLLAAPLGFRTPARRYLPFYFIGMFFNLLLPTSVGGDVVRALYLSAGERDLPRPGGGPPPGRGEAMLSVFADRASGLAILVVMACLAGLFAPTPLPGWMNGLLCLLGGGTVLGVAALPALPLLKKVPFVGARLGRLVDAARAYLRCPGVVLATTLLSVLVQLSSVLFVWLIGRALGLGVSFAYMAAAVPLLTLLTLVPLSVNGMGLREMGMVVLLGPVGVSGAQAVTLSLLTFAAAAAVSLVGGVLYLLGRPARSDEPVRGTDEIDIRGRSDAEPVRGGADQGRTRQPPAAA
jgi:uncharacterized membrane protein YbhN (UPF0104 family)